jgi:hypothetical protein
VWVQRAAQENNLDPLLTLDLARDLRTFSDIAGDGINRDALYIAEDGFTIGDQPVPKGSFVVASGPTVGRKYTFDVLTPDEFEEYYSRGARESVMARSAMTLQRAEESHTSLEFSAHHHFSGHFDSSLRDLVEHNWVEDDHAFGRMVDSIAEHTILRDQAFEYLKGAAHLYDKYRKGGHPEMADRVFRVLDHIVNDHNIHYPLDLRGPLDGALDPDVPKRMLRGHIQHIYEQQGARAQELGQEPVPPPAWLQKPEPFHAEGSRSSRRFWESVHGSSREEINDPVARELLRQIHPQGDVEGGNTHNDTPPSI